MLFSTFQFYYTEVYPSLISYLDQLVKPVYESVGSWNDAGDDSTRMLRSFIMEIGCLTGIKDCLDNAGNQFMKWGHTLKLLTRWNNFS